LYLLDNRSVKHGAEVNEENLYEDYIATDSMSSNEYAIMSFITAESYYLERIQLYANQSDTLTINVMIFLFLYKEWIHFILLNYF